MVYRGTWCRTFNLRYSTYRFYMYGTLHNMSCMHMYVPLGTCIPHAKINTKKRLHNLCILIFTTNHSPQHFSTFPPPLSRCGEEYAASQLPPPVVLVFVLTSVTFAPSCVSSTVCLALLPLHLYRPSAQQSMLLKMAKMRCRRSCSTAHLFPPSIDAPSLHCCCLFSIFSILSSLLTGLTFVGWT